MLLLHTILYVMHALFSILNHLRKITNFSSNLFHIHKHQLLQIQINYDVTTDVIHSTDY